MSPTKIYYENHKEQAKLWHEDYYSKNKEKLIKYTKDYYIKNRDEVLLKAKEYRSKHKEKILRYNKKYRDTHKEWIKKYLKEYKSNNKNLVKAYLHNRRIKEGNSGKLTKTLIQQVYEDNIKRYSTLTCVLCNKPIKFGEDTLEHLIPIFRGGTNKYGNLAIAHYKCNSSKGKKTLEEFKDFKQIYAGNLL